MNAIQLVPRERLDIGVGERRGRPFIFPNVGGYIRGNAYGEFRVRRMNKGGSLLFVRWVGVGVKKGNSD